ncbi:MAG: tRNA1(Val) (adenine(37)-N6)-methyltransferase [Firmicutes bacterium]|nr:tRNA1(Val) (adenine(37)-N6)-methyltransferase [Bacillota bacterium]
MDPKPLRIDEIGFGGIKLLQDPAQFCFGVDAVLLAHFARAEETDRVCELGSGNGAASFILYAKYHPRQVTGIELQEGPYALASRTAVMNGLEDHISFLHSDILQLKMHLAAETMDLVISNPPYMEKGSSLVNPESEKGIARHETTAVLSDFMREAARLLRAGGRLCMVHRPFRLGDLIESARAAGLEPKKLQAVVPKAGADANILLMEFVKGAGKELQFLPQLAVRNDDGSYTQELRAIYGSWYGHPFSPASCGNK